MQPAIVFLLIKKYPYAIVIVISVVLINLIVAFARRIYATKVLNATIHYHGQDRGFVKGLFQLSSAILFALIADQIFWKADQLVIGKMLNTSAVAVYSVGSQIYMNYTHWGQQFLVYLCRNYQNYMMWKRIYSQFRNCLLK